MSADPTTVIAALGVEPTYSAREAAVLLGRSYSWLDQRLRAGQFIRTDGTAVAFTVSFMTPTPTSNQTSRNAPGHPSHSGRPCGGRLSQPSIRHR